MSDLTLVSPYMSDVDGGNEWFRNLPEAGPNMLNKNNVYFGLVVLIVLGLALLLLPSSCLPSDVAGQCFGISGVALLGVGAVGAMACLY